MGAARGKLGMADIGGVVRNFEGEVLICFFKPIGIKDSNLNALRVFFFFFNSFSKRLIVECDSTNVIS